MDRIRITGGRPLNGEIEIGGAKNAALPLLASSILTPGTLVLENLPIVADIRAMALLLAELGVQTEMDAERRAISMVGDNITETTAPYDIVRKMRASVLVLGPLLARFGKARVSLPGGCAIGTRPVDLHLKALEQMGAKIELSGGYINAHVNGRLKGTHILFPSITVGGTENILMAAVLADGETVIANAAREPEVTDLARCLQAMGANITGIGSDTLHVTGVEELGSARYSVVPDRIETGTYAVAAAITGGNVLLRHAEMASNEAVFGLLMRAGVEVVESEDGIRVTRQNGRIRGVDVMTEPYPGFPTDMQAQFMALLSLAEGASMITESIFENRFMHVPELLRMGADINVHGSSAIVRGVPKLSGAPVMATDLRASVSLVLAGLAAEGVTDVNRVYHLDRGYERIEQKLAACGADIERMPE
ncbi:UDP-N-acetylglucosamine 1-carboxyvinyltransferase [Thalassospiraceae bacterium LMO-JJ14]|nr:UDP-N-acetylglucosamine 1-carboxyvinyltransferase [Thalassospiraceae bacterium LMO-JJ14]